MAAGDFYVGADGRFQFIDELDKAAQDLAEQLISPFNPTTGEGNEVLSDDPQSARVAAVFSRDLIESRIADVVRRLQQFQSRDPAITPAEKIERIVDLRVFVLPSDKRNVGFYLKCEVESGEVITRTFGVDLSHIFPDDPGRIPVPT
jgi:hypothetical protein